MKKIPGFLAIFLILTIQAVSQERHYDLDFFPYISQLSVETRNNLIRLSWVDSPDVRGPVYIFRSARPFTGSIPANIRPVVVRYGTQYYVDDTDDMETIHYFIAASDISGRRYDVIIPFINSANVNRSLGGVQAAQIPPAQSITGHIEGITNLRTRQDDDKVIITYPADPHKNAILYRSMHPIRTPQDLLNAVIIQPAFVSPFVDNPVPGITWYYAVIYEDDIFSGNMGIRPGINATVSAVIIENGEIAEQSMRPIPLPLMTLHNFDTGGFFSDAPRDIPLSRESSIMLSNSYMPSKVPLELKKPRVFMIDLQSPASGEESALFQIIKEYFEKYDWERARISLQHYLSLPRSPDVQARAQFYLGQTFYFTGDFRDALFEFLAFRPFHPAEANSWIDAVLAAMVH